jgi:hypothetical protein
MAADSIGDPILIRFDGIDADEHEIEISAFAESLRGLSRVLAVAGNFAATQKYVQHLDAMDVRIVVGPSEPKCFQFLAFVKWAAEDPLIATVVGGLFVSLVCYIFSRAAGKREEMKQIRGALDVAIKELGTRDQATVDRLLETVDKMADALKPAARQAVAPVGKTANSLTIASVSGGQAVTLGTAEKAAMSGTAATEVGDEKTYEILVTELDLETGACKFLFINDLETRFSGKITDPALGIPNNGYAMGLASMQPIHVRAKATLREGAIDKLFISNMIEHRTDGSRA